MQFIDGRTREGKRIKEVADGLVEKFNKEFVEGDKPLSLIEHLNLIKDYQTKMKEVKYAANYAQANSKGKSRKHWDEQYEIGLMSYRMGVNDEKGGSNV